MYSPYGKWKHGGMFIGLSPSDSAITKPPEPDRTESNRFPRCRGCPYPRHGLFCWTDSKTCLRTEMAEIERKNRGLEVAVI